MQTVDPSKLKVTKVRGFLLGIIIKCMTNVNIIFAREGEGGQPSLQVNIPNNAFAGRKPKNF